MSCLGVHLALLEEEATSLRAIESESERLVFLQETIEGTYLAKSDGFFAESEKAWDAIHRVLTDGELSWTGGTYPLNHVVLAGELLYTKPDYIMSLKTPVQVVAIAEALLSVTEEGLRERYFRIDSNSYGIELSDEDFLHTLDGFNEVKRLYEIAAANDRFVLFTVDQ